MMKTIRAFFMCLGMFSSIPCPYRPWDEDARGLMTACLPIVGAVIGLIWALVAMIASAVLPEPLAAALIAAMPFLLTGFMHLDGFMDTSDAILSWRPLEDRLRIIKDSHTGSFAVVNIALLMMFMFASAESALKADLRALILVPVISRCGSAFCVITLKPLGHSEYKGLDADAGQRAAIIAIWLIAILIGFAWLGRMGCIFIIETLGYAIAMRWSSRIMKGVSGDLAGFSLSISEVCALAALAVF